jgi:hypothetical protein
MKHLQHEELVDSIYGEGSRETAEHLETCAACAGARRALEGDLAEVTAAATPEPGAGYEVRLWSALSRQLPAYPRQRRLWRRPAFWLSLSGATVCAVLMAAAFVAGRAWEHGHQPRSTAAAAPAPAPKKVVVVVLSDHLDRSERLLVELKHADADDATTLAPMRDEARNLLAANSTCRHEAEKIGDPDLTAALDRLEQLLTELANQPGGLNAAAIERLQNEMNADGLLLEIRVLRSRLLDRRTSTSTQVKEGGTA